MAGRMGDRPSRVRLRAPQCCCGRKQPKDRQNMTKFKASTRKDLPQIAEKLKLEKEQILDMQAVSAVLPFRVNDYVVENLIDPSDVPDDPIFQLTFPQRSML